MKAIQILMDETTIEAVDREARQQCSDRSKLIRAAITGFLAEQRRRRLEEEHRRGYKRKPQRPNEIEEWETIQQWPEE
jgi:metal-responsive CopG/Arc/MetJ family transcriptional regulator